MKYDLLIKNGRIIDGTGAPWKKADIASHQGKIIIKPRPGLTAHRIIDAEGLYVTPGFIDMHTHSDLPLLVSGLAESKIRQGVTTEVIGNCGFSLVPAVGSFKNKLAKNFRKYKLDIDLTSPGDYFSLLEKQGIALNVVGLVGHGTIRKSVIGYAERKASNKEIELMKELLEQEMQEGATGLSTGLFYPPSSYADQEELIELAQVVSQYDGIYTTHLRDEGNNLLLSIEETIEIGQKANLPVHISHHKQEIKNLWGMSKKSLSLMESAREAGVDISCDIYPYQATSTTLVSILPSWAQADGNSALLKRLADNEIKDLIIAHLNKTQKPRGFNNIYISALNNQHNKAFVGKNIEQISKMLNISPVEAIIQLIIEEKGEVEMVRFAMCEEDIERILKNRLTMIGSDGSSLATEGVLAEGRPHPRNFGTFPRIIKKYVKERKVLKLEEAIFKMTGLPAWRLNLLNRGLIKDNFAADLTIFDLNQIKDLADYQNPFQYPQGIKYVIVNGKIVLDKNKHTLQRAGKIL